jgi:hypothetical protein
MLASGQFVRQLSNLRGERLEIEGRSRMTAVDS